MDWTAEEIRQLRYRLGWSRAELARSLNCALENVFDWEEGQTPPAETFRNDLQRFHHQAETNAERIQRRPVAERIMQERNLSQIHDMDVIDCLANGALSHLSFKP